MAVTFDTLKFVENLERVNLTREQASTIAAGIREVQETTLTEQAKVAHEASERAVAALDTKTERAVAALGSETERAVAALGSETERAVAALRADFLKLDAKIEIARRDTIIKLGGMLIVGFGTTIGVLFKLMG